MSAVLYATVSWESLPNGMLLDTGKVIKLLVTIEIGIIIQKCGENEIHDIVM